MSHPRRPYVVRTARGRAVGTYGSEAAAWRAVDRLAKPGLTVYHCGRPLARQREDQLPQ